MVISWCAVMTYAFSGLVLIPPRGASLWHRELLGLGIVRSQLGWPGLAMAGAVVLSAVLLRRSPLTALGLLLGCVIAEAMAAAALQIASFLIAPAGVTVGFIAANRSRRVSVVAAVIAFGVLARYATGWRSHGLVADSWPVAIIIAWLIGQSIRQNRLHAATLHTQAAAAAVTAERLRITSELHDMVAHSIGVIAIQADAGSRVISTQPAEARNALSAIEATSRETLACVRRTLGALRRGEPGERAGHASAGLAAPIGATPRPAFPGRARLGAWMVASWCAVIAYVVSAQVIGPGGFLLLAPGARRPVPTGMAGLRVVVDGLAAVPWPLLATAGVLVLSAVLLCGWPLCALALLLSGGIAASVIPEPLLVGNVPIPPALTVPAFFLIPPAGVAVGYIATVRSRPVSVGAAVIAAGVLAICAGGFGFAPSGFANGTSAALAAAVATVIAWLIGHAIRQDRLHATTLRSQAEATAVTAERLRIARELHDMVAHSIGVIAIQAGAGSRVIDTQPAEARNALAAIEAASREALAGLQRTLEVSRGPGTAPGPALALDPAPGLSDIGQLVATAMSAGVRVDVRWRGEQRPLPIDIDQSAFRIIQEAVTNVVRHAGTSRCEVTIDQDDDEVAIEVVDDGRGGAAEGTGYGITGMHERALLLHGQLTAEPLPQGGFRVAARLPLPAAAAV
jgi:signal transduction histidine kinase